MRTPLGTAICIRQIVQFICNSALADGDQLPPQLELCQRLRTGNQTISAAMHALVDLGLLKRKTRVGTVIADLTALERLPWTVGVASIPATARGPTAFFALLHHQIISALSEANCRSMSYLRHRPAHWPLEVRDFPGLEDSVNQRDLDGLILMTNLNHADWRRLDELGTAVCHAGPFADVCCGIVIDRIGFVSEATQVLQDAGCRQIAIADVLPQEGESTREHASPTAALSIGGIEDLEAGRATARALSQRPANERPDGIVAADDYSAMWLAEGLKRAGDDYRPMIACITNRQLPLSYALSVRQWELDINLLAARTVALIQGRLLGRVKPDCVQYFKPVALAQD